jgi:hypothetical protein
MAVPAGELDELEQITRIEQMQVDIRLKEQALKLAPRQLFATWIAAAGAAIAAVATAVKVWVGH